MLSKLYDDFAGQDEWEFKKNTLSYAGDTQECNRKKLNILADRTNMLSLAFAVEVLLFAVWITDLA